MTIQQWRTDKARVKKANELLSNPFLKEMLDTVVENQKASHSVSKVGLSDGDRSYLLGTVDGHNYAVTVMKSLGTLVQKKADVDVTYGAEKKDS